MTLPRLSNSEYCRMAWAIPRERPVKITTDRVTALSRRVLGSFSVMMSKTGRSWAMEMPKSPVARLAIMRPYWTWTG